MWRLGGILRLYAPTEEQEHFDALDADVATLRHYYTWAADSECELAKSYATAERELNNTKQELKKMKSLLTEAERNLADDDRLIDLLYGYIDIIHEELGRRIIDERERGSEREPNTVTIQVNTHDA